MSLVPRTIASAGGETEADFVPAANMVCCSLRHRGIERLAQRRGLETYAEAGKTMGIPLLYPWANRLERFGYEAAGKAVRLPTDDPRIPRDAAGLPIHGVVPHLLRWEVLDGSDSSRLDARLAWSAPDLLELFPFRHEVRLSVRVGEGSLSVETSVRATGGEPVPIAFGYHPYLLVPQASRDAWEIELAASRRLGLDDRGIPTGRREPVGVRRTRLGQTSWDDAFDGLPVPARFGVSAGGVGAASAVTVEFETGYGFAQVFAPAEQEFICFEPMTAAANALNSGDGLQVVPPGAEYAAAFSVRLSDPDP
jgi:aldose 1-epimerase